MEALEFSNCGQNAKSLKDEHIISYKVYDSCRRQNCLTHKQLGPSRTSSCCSGDSTTESNIIRPPQRAASVTVDGLSIKKIYITKKRPNPFKSGYWDLNIGFVFEYLLTFWEFDGCEISTVEAGNVFNMKATLHGSNGNGLVIATDLYSSDSGLICNKTPFFWVGGNAICLDAEIHRNSHQDCHNEVWVKIGLFSVIKLLRLASLSVSSKGFCIPNECDEPVDPCRAFADMNFIEDIFDKHD